MENITFRKEKMQEAINNISGLPGSARSIPESDFSILQSIGESISPKIPAKDLMDAIQAEKQSLEQLRTQRDKTEKFLHSYHALIRQHQNTNRQMQALSKELHQVQAELVCKDQQLVAQQVTCRNLKAQLQNVIMQRSGVIQEIKEYYQNLILQYEEENKSLREKHQKIEYKTNQQIKYCQRKGFKQKQKDQVNNLSETSGKQTERQSVPQELQQKVKQLQTKLGILLDSFKLKCQNTQKLRQQTAQKFQEAKRACSTLQYVNKQLSDEIGYLKSILREREVILVKSRQNLEGSLKDANQLISQLRQQNKSLSEQSVSLSEQNCSLQEENGFIKMQLNTLRQKIKYANHARMQQPGLAKRRISENQCWEILNSKEIKKRGQLQRDQQQDEAVQSWRAQ